MSYKPFDQTSKKLAKNVETQNDNASEVKNNIEKIDTSFLTNHSLKKIHTVNLLTDELIGGSFQTFDFYLQNFPSWAIDMTYPRTIIRLPSGWDLTKRVNSFTESLNEGTLEDDDISIISQDIQSFWTQLGSSVWKFSLRVNFTMTYVELREEGGFNSHILPVFLNADLVIVNQRNYDAIQSGKK